MIIRDNTGVIAATAVMATSIVIASVAVASASGPTRYIDNDSQVAGQVERTADGVFDEGLDVTLVDGRVDVGDAGTTPDAARANAFARAVATGGPLSRTAITLISVCG